MADPVARPRLLQRVADDIALEWLGTFSPETVDRFVHESYEALARHGSGSLFLIVLTERFVRERLTALAQAEGRVPKAVPEVLFVCVSNAGRSVMAAALLESYAEGRVRVRSAGSVPVGQIDPKVVAALEEVGIPIDEAFPKPLTDEVVQAADVVITMGCGDACPIHPGKRYVDWPVADPADRPIEDVRGIRDDVDRRVRDLLAELEAGERR
jgi:protein-tyrosine-phosphatase